MFSAYVDYLVLIVIGALFAAVGFAFFRVGLLRSRVQQRHGCIPGMLMLIGLVGMLLGLGVILWNFSSPTPWQRIATCEHIFHTPPERIIQVTIRARSLAPLVNKDLTVSDRAEIQRIALALGKAREDEGAGEKWDSARYWFWHAPIELSTKDGTFYFKAGVSRSRGACVMIGTEPDGYGWRIGTFRAEELARVLEQLRDREPKS